MASAQALLFAASSRAVLLSLPRLPLLRPPLPSACSLRSLRFDATLCFADATAPKSPRFASTGTASRLVSSFTRSSPNGFWISSREMRVNHQRSSVSIIRCGQGAKQSNGLDVWLGRLAMVGFATAITVEISTGKGLLENLGFTAPLPTIALAVTALVGALTAFFIFQSASRE